MNIRPLEPEDQIAAVDLYRELVGTIPVSHADEDWQKLLDHPGTTVFGAEIDGAIVAIVTLHILPNMTFGGRSYALIENVVTASAHQGRGIGKAVMQRAMEAAWDADCYKIMLLTGKKFESKGFYEKLGFVADQKHGMIIRRAPQRQPDVKTN